MAFVVRMHNLTITDPECCDGSDETDGKIQCPNVCEKNHKEYKRRMAQEEKVHTAGSRVRAKYIAKARSDRQARMNKLQSLKAKLPELILAEDSLRSAKENSQSAEEFVQEQKRQNPLYKKLEERHRALDTLLSATESALDELRVVARFIERLDKDHAVESIERAKESFETWLGTNDDDDAIQSIEDRIRTIREEAPSRDEIRALSQESIYDMLDYMPDDDDALDASSMLYHIPSYLPDALIPLYERALSWISRTLVHLNLIKPSRVRSSAWQKDGLQAAHDKHRESEEALDNLKQEIQMEEEALNQWDDKYGREGEFFSLQGKCVTSDMGSYTYELCFGEKTAQISNNDGYRFNLGYFKHFDMDQQYDRSDDRHYLSMLFDDGQVCWNGPPRSSRVTLECGEEEALLHVFEAEKCTYQMHVKTPAVCFDRKKADNEAAVNHDEL